MYLDVRTAVVSGGEGDVCEVKQAAVYYQTNRKSISALFIESVQRASCSQTVKVWT